MKKIIIKTSIALLSFVMILGVMLLDNPQVLNAQTKIKDDMSNLIVNKTAQDNQDGSYTLRLESYVTGDVSVTSKSKPTDIVLVLDQSGSMIDPIEIKTQYHKIFSNGSETMSDYMTYYIEKNGAYIPITFKERIPAKDYVPLRPKWITLWESSDGEVLVAQMENGDNPDDRLVSDEERYPAYQAYWKSEAAEEGTSSKLDSLKQAVNAFVKDAASEKNDHRIAITGFAAGEVDAAGLPSYKNTEMFIGSDRYTYNSTEISEQYANAFQSTASGENSQPVKNLQASLRSLQAQGATRADLGMNMAEQIFANNPIDTKERNRVAILFTDGAPTNSNVFSDEVANATIAKAQALKEQGVSVFTVGVVDSLNNNLDPTQPTTDDLNRYMQYVSSNYPNATSLLQSGVGDYTGGKYLFAKNQEELMSVFVKINEEITSTTSTLDETTILKDVLSDQFKLGETPDVKVYTQAYLGMDTWGNEVVFDDAITEIDPITKEINVHNFNYKNYPVSDGSTPMGVRLVVEIKVYPEDGFLGGNNVATNKNTSGIYVKEDMKKPFPLPEVNTEIRMDALRSETSIYQTQDIANIADSLLDVEAKAEGIQYRLNQTVHTVDGVNNKYVDIVYEFLDSDDQPIGVHATLPAGSTTITWNEDASKLNTTDLNNNTTYKLNVTIKPITLSDKENSATETQIKGEALINVFKPITSVKNDIAFFGGRYDLTQVVEDVTWTCVENPLASKVDETQAAPELSYTYSKNGGTISDPVQYLAEEESNFVMNVAANGRDITELNSFTNQEAVDQATFKISLIKGQLQITKQVDKAYSENKFINANQTFIFRIDVYDPLDATLTNTYYKGIDFDQYDFNNGSASKTITLKGLRAGLYEINEEKSWSWKYDMINSKTNYLDESKQLYIGNPDASISNGAYPYFGVEDNTMYNNENIGNPGTITIQNALLRSNVIGDCASAINQF